MVLGISEDFTRDIVMDAELSAASSTGLTLNSGVHASITLDNLLEFLPDSTTTFLVWNDVKTYSVYSTTKNRADIVSLNSKIYQSIKGDNTNNSPDEVDSIYWMETNIESLVLKSFIDKVKDKVYSDLNLIKRLVNSQKIYEVGRHDMMLPNQYCGYVFEPKGSDYLSFTLNQITFQGLTTDAVNLYVVNEGRLVDTLILRPNDGAFEWKNLGYKFKGEGKWIFAVDSQMVKTNQGVVDPLKYDGFVVYTTTGLGGTPEGATWVYETTGNGLGFNVSVSLDSSIYIDNNIEYFGGFIRSTFELMTLQMFLHNANNRSNRNEFIQLNKELLVAETKSLEMNTVARHYQKELERAKRAIEKTFDSQLSPDDDGCFEIELSSN
jgi:hypothetical protein